MNKFILSDENGEVLDINDKFNNNNLINDSLINDKIYNEFQTYIKKMKEYNKNMTKLINKRENELNEIYKKQNQNNKNNNLLNNNENIIKFMDKQDKEFKHNDNLKLNIYDLKDNFKNIKSTYNMNNNNNNNNNEENINKEKENENKINNLINKRDEDINKVYKNMRQKEIDFTNINIEQDEEELNYSDDDLNMYKITDTPIKNEKIYKYELITNYLKKILQSINHNNNIHKYLKINILDINKNEMFIELEFDKFTYIKQDYIYNKIINYVYSYNNKNNISPILKDIKFNIVSVVNGFFM